MTTNHAIKIKMSFAFIRTKIKLYTHCRYNKGEEGKGKKDDNGFFIYFRAVEMSHEVCIWNWVTGLFQPQCSGLDN